MNRKIYLLLTVLLAWSFNLKAQTAQIGSTTANPGDPVPFGINVAGFPDTVVGAISLFIGYDANVLTFTGTTAGTITGYISNNMTGTQQVGIQWTNPDGQTINGVLLTLNFIYNGLGGECDLTFNAGCEFTENDLDPITVAYTSGHIGPISGIPTLTIEDKFTTAGPTTVDITAAGFDPTLLGAITLYIKYNPAVATFTGTLPGKITGFYAWASNGVIGISWSNPTGDSTIDGTLLTLKFNYSGAGTTALTFQTGCEIVELDFTPVVVSYNSGSINPGSTSAFMTLSNEVALAGNPANFVITASGYPDTVGAITLFIGFDPNCLTFLNISPGTISGANANVVSPGVLGISWTNQAGQAIDGSLLTIHFLYIIGNCAVTFNSGCEIADYELNIIPTTFTNGSMMQGTGGAIAEMESKTGTVGQPISFPILVSNFPPNVGAISLFIEFNNTVLQYTGFTYGDSITSGIYANYIPAQSKIGIQWSDYEGVNISPNPKTVLLTLNFMYLGGFCDLTFGLGCEFAQNDLDPIDVGYYNGAVVIGTKMNIKAFLEGPFNGATMNTTLNSGGYLPLTQPYSGAPWNYSGTENIGSIPNSNVVDWILLEIRETAGAANTATSSTVVARKAALILNNGNIVSLDGSSEVLIPLSFTNNVYVVIYHRNHLSMMSSVPVTPVSDIYTYDFTTAQGQAYLNGQKVLTGGYGMFTGDADANGQVQTADKNIWFFQFGLAGYKSADFDLNGQVQTADKNKWFFNFGIGTTVP
jgi:hypothetical protein